MARKRHLVLWFEIQPHALPEHQAVDWAVQLLVFKHLSERGAVTSERLQVELQHARHLRQMEAIRVGCCAESQR